MHQSYIIWRRWLKKMKMICKKLKVKEQIGNMGKITRPYLGKTER